MNSSRSASFSTGKLDQLLDEAAIDILIVTSKHNIQYLLGGYYHFQFDYMEAIGISRFLPIVIYFKGAIDKAAYVANRNERDSIETRIAGGHWMPQVLTGSSTTVDAIELAIKHVKAVATRPARVGIEMSFLPVDAADALRQQLGEFRFVEAMRPLEKLRAVKSPRELEILRQASDLVVDSMLDTVKATCPGQTKRQIIDHLRRAEIARDMTFEYALVTLGSSLNRAPSDQRLLAGDIMSLDSGGNYQGYIGDLCRMAVHGSPDAELVDLLAEIDAIQQAARAPIKSGLMGRDIYSAAQIALGKSAHAKNIRFGAHGMGIVSHEAPRLTATGPIPYPADDTDRPLEAGMILSIETTLTHPRRGFIKLEDTLAVMEAGYDAFGDHARGWNSIPD